MSLKQFVHIEEYALGGNRVKHTRSIRNIFGEAMRQKGFCNHINEGALKKPRYLYGNNLFDVEKQLNRIAGHAVMKNGKAIRKNHSILLAGVASYPVSNMDITNLVSKNRLDNWLHLTTSLLIEEFGDCLKSVVLHEDEGYPHVHFYAHERLTKNKQLSTNAIHPGKCKQIIDNAKSKEERIESYKIGMSLFMDRFYDAVSINFEHERGVLGNKHLSYKEFRFRKPKLKKKRVFAITARKPAAMELLRAVSKSTNAVRFRAGAGFTL
jgi:hypothetical protein